MSGGRFSLEARFKALDGFTAPIRRMRAGLDRLMAGAGLQLKRLNSVLDSVHERMKMVGTATLGMGVAAGAALFQIGRTGAGFDQAMANVAAVSLVTRDQIQDLEKEARKLGLTTRYSATEVAEGMELMSKAGFSNQETLAGIGGMLNAAAAEGASFAETASTISNTLKG